MRYKVCAEYKLKISLSFELWTWALSWGKKIRSPLLCQLSNGKHTEIASRVAYVKQAKAREKPDTGTGLYPCEVMSWCQLGSLSWICSVKHKSLSTEHHSPFLLTELGLQQWGLGCYGLLNPEQKTNLSPSQNYCCWSSAIHFSLNTGMLSSPLALPMLCHLCSFPLPQHQLLHSRIRHPCYSTKCRYLGGIHHSYLSASRGDSKP